MARNAHILMILPFPLASDMENAPQPPSYCLTRFGILPSILVVVKRDISAIKG